MTPITNNYTALKSSYDDRQLDIYWNQKEYAYSVRYKGKVIDCIQEGWMTCVDLIVPKGKNPSKKGILRGEFWWGSRLPQHGLVNDVSWPKTVTFNPKDHTFMCVDTCGERKPILYSVLMYISSGREPIMFSFGEI